MKCNHHSNITELSMDTRPAWTSAWTATGSWSAQPSVDAQPASEWTSVPDSADLTQQTMPHEFVGVFALAALTGAAVTLYVKMSRKNSIEPKPLLG